MSKLLSPDNPLMQEISKATDYIIAKFLFIVFSIPIFTIGASACAEYAVIMKIRRGEDPSVAKEFWKAFKSNFKQASIIWAIHFPITVFLVIDWYLLYTKDNIYSYIGLFFAIFTVFAMAGFMCSYAFCARFVATTPMVLRGGFAMAFLKLPMLLVIIVCSAAPYIISIWYIKWAPLIWVVLKLAEMMLTAGLFVKMLKKVEEGVFGKSEEENEESEEDEEGSAEEPVVVRLTEETEAARRKSENKSENKSEEKSEKKSEKESDKDSDKDDAEVKTASE